MGKDKKLSEKFIQVHMQSICRVILCMSTCPGKGRYCLMNVRRFHDFTALEIFFPDFTMHFHWGYGNLSCLFYACLRVI